MQKLEKAKQVKKKLKAYKQAFVEERESGLKAKTNLEKATNKVKQLE